MAEKAKNKKVKNLLTKREDSLDESEEEEVKPAKKAPAKAPAIERAIERATYPILSNLILSLPLHPSVEAPAAKRSTPAEGGRGF